MAGPETEGEDMPENMGRGRELDLDNRHGKKEKGPGVKK